MNPQLLFIVKHYISNPYHDFNLLNGDFKSKPTQKYNMEKEGYGAWRSREKFVVEQQGLELVKSAGSYKNLSNTD